MFLNDVFPFIHFSKGSLMAKYVVSDGTSTVTVESESVALTEAAFVAVVDSLKTSNVVSSDETLLTYSKVFTRAEATNA